jgi:iron complex outermembrane receptor protein
MAWHLAGKCKLGVAMAASVAGLLPANARGGQQPSAPTPVPTVVVSGIRASLQTAVDIKRGQPGFVDAVVADDIDKLPDHNVTDALQRISGVQITRDRGEGAGVAIRGLTQMETLLNGREVFTAGTGRTLDFADIPAELVSSLHVYKTGAAAHIEGGVGGTIDVRTRRPFDFRDKQLALTARLNHGDLVGSSALQTSLLASGRWRSAGMGEFGALLSLSKQRRAWREDQKSTGNLLSRSDLVPGQVVLAPNGATENASVGRREREAASLVLEWRPAAGVELYAEGSHAHFLTLQDTYQVNAAAGTGFVAGSATVFPGTNDLRSVTWTNAPLSILSFARDTTDRTRQAALGGRWRADRWRLSADLSHTDSDNRLFFSGPILAARAASFTQDLSGKVAANSLAGTDLLNPANLRYAGLAHRTRPFDGDLNAAQLDAEYQLDGGLVDTLAAGLRVARRGAGNAPGLIFADTTLPGQAVESKPGFAIPHPYGALFPGEGGAGMGQVLVGNLALARDPVAQRSAFGIDAPLPLSANPLSLWQIRERTEAAWLQANLKEGRLPLDGNLGLRMVRTRELVQGAQSAPAAGGSVPIQVDSSYTDYLPSLNLRYRLREGLYLRGAASRSVTRPNFDQLSPSLVLNRNPINPALNQGTAGNPALAPVRADNLDLALERYAGPAGTLYATAFLKQVEGFVGTVSSLEIHDGVSYQVSRPQNTAGARIKGVELGYQQFFEGLPDWMRGLGVQANYTFVDSTTPGAALGGRLPLQNLSRHSANLVGIVERGPLSARIAYNWRDKFLSSVTNVVGIGALPVYTDAYGWLDASCRYRVNEQVSIALEGTNLLRTVRTAYYGVATRPQSAWLNDRQVSLVVTVRY